MKPDRSKTVHVNVTFPDRSLARPVLEEIGRDRGLTVNILRGRITEEIATFELEVTGAARRVDDLIRLSATWGTTVGSPPLILARGSE